MFRVILGISFTKTHYVRSELPIFYRSLFTCHMSLWGRFTTEINGRKCRDVRSVMARSDSRDLRWWIISRHHAYHSPVSGVRVDRSTLRQRLLMILSLQPNAIQGFNHLHVFFSSLIYYLYFKWKFSPKWDYLLFLKLYSKPLFVENL